MGGGKTKIKGYHWYATDTSSWNLITDKPITSYSENVSSSGQSIWTITDTDIDFTKGYFYTITTGISTDSYFDLYQAEKYKNIQVINKHTLQYKQTSISLFGFIELQSGDIGMKDFSRQDTLDMRIIKYPSSPSKDRTECNFSYDRLSYNSGRNIANDVYVHYTSQYFNVQPSPNGVWVTEFLIRGTSPHFTATDIIPKLTTGIINPVKDDSWDLSLITSLSLTRPSGQLNFYSVRGKFVKINND